MSAKVSICIPAYCQPELLARTLESIQMQTFRDYEVIVTDDSPGDEVEDVVARYAQECNIRYSRNRSALGTPENWNYAISLARGELIKVLHHDDWFPSPHCLARFVGLLESNPDVEFAFSATSVCDITGNLQRLHKPPPGWLEQAQSRPDVLLFGNMIGCPSCTIYRSTLPYRYDPRLRWLVDVDFYFAVLVDQRRIAYCDEPLVCTTDGAPHQVTSKCRNNPSVELSEWWYLAAKMKRRGVRLTPQHIQRAAMLALRCGVALPGALYARCRALLVQRFTSLHGR